MNIQLPSNWAHTAQTFAVASIIVAFVSLIPKIEHRLRLSKIPKLVALTDGLPEHTFFAQYATKLYRQGYEKFKDSIYRVLITGELECILLPTKFLPELRKKPDDVLDIMSGAHKLFEVKYTKHKALDLNMIHCIKANLTPALGRLNHDITEEIDIAFEKELPPCKDWTDVNVHDKIANIVAQVSGRMFVGPEVCRKPEYIDHAVNFTTDFNDAVFAVKCCNPWLRPFMTSRLPAMQRFNDRIRRATEFFTPIILSRMKPENKSDDMMQWMLDYTLSTGKSNTMYEHVKRQLDVTFAAIHTTATTVVNCLYTLTSMPEYIAPLQEEIRSVRAAHGGELNAQALQQLVKLDSVLKEIGRMYPVTVTAFQRMVMKPFTLSNGQQIPAGTMIEIPLEALNYDSNVHTNADKFDGFRYYRERQSAKGTEVAQSQFVSANDRDLYFGYGRHACPGRFFAANEIKIIMARLLLDYEFKMPGDQTKRYDQVSYAKFLTPDASKTLLMKRTS
ncbi:hypothetical protein COCCADRAFT_6006 [Bipolaris zeicola 26-R-13]|uniref:Cytochrome P450 monooxygenase n=1 Tax=Cochliobolus carbonum (strain 26-R-13) TaxID=930089 RepID=W6YA09_COCC2|nr:uncharacterized protein COCCADRAFT_6006 [Bipolaris zeicola 26-R-13]EUC32269.1 hypothetical protein COCCADRAFT_6006 [Bipolaris zeicola 26-R-13]